MTATVLSLAAVLGYALAFPPLDWGFLGWVALWPWCGLARRLRGARLFFLGWLLGAALLTAGCFWLRRTSPLLLLPVVIPEGLAFGGFAWLLRWLLVELRKPAALCLPLAFVGMEFVRGRFPLDGFPWLLLGYTQHRCSMLLQLADLTGVLGLSALLALAAGALDDWTDGRRGVSRKARVAGAWSAALALVGSLVYGQVRLHADLPLSRGPRMLLVQPNISQQLKAPANADSMLAWQIRMAREGLEQSEEPIDLVVFAETATWGLEHDRPDPGEADWVRRVLREFDSRSQTWWLTGVGTRAQPEAHADASARRGIYNSALLFDPQGARRGGYDKYVLVPGGEYLPWIEHFPDALARWTRSWVEGFAGFLPDVRAGSGPILMELTEGNGRTCRLGPSICFEIAYPEVGRRLSRLGAHCLINLSNEAWFPRSAEYEQYAAMAAFRAVEVRRSLVRCGNSGISGWIDPWGRRNDLVVAGARFDVSGTMVVTPDLTEVSTFYARAGDWPGLLALGGLLLLGAVRVVTRRRGGKL